MPAALLVEHPAVPVPTVDGSASESLPKGDAVSASSLSRRERFSAALQLTAATSLLAEFDLWPGRTAIRAARFTRTPSGLWVSLARFPVPMSRVYSRLGGGEGAAATTRAAVLEAISDTVGLPLAAIRPTLRAPIGIRRNAPSRRVHAAAPSTRDVPALATRCKH